MGNEVIMERLDRAYASPYWAEQYPEAVLHNLPIAQSDHGPIILYTNPPSGRQRRPYQVENWCLHQTPVQHMILDIWGINIYGLLCIHYRDASTNYNSSSKNGV